jgi:predicted homoserine dehydrogenase-like protein
MFNFPAQLAEREEPVRVGVIGAGLFGTNLIDQLERVDGLRTAAVADIETDKAVDTLRKAGVQGSEVVRAGGAAEAQATMEDGDRAVLARGEKLVETDVDVVVEATGRPEVGARHAYGAIMAGTDIVMATVETDTVVGPVLARMAENNDVTYSMAYGDQPGCIVELCDWARTVGLDIVATGKGNPYLSENRFGTPDDVFERIGFEDEFVERHGLNPRMFNSFFDGTKVAVEMCAVANALGLEPDVPGMHIPTAEISEIPEKLRLKEDGGLLNNTGVVETVGTLTDDGTRIDPDLSLGVYVVTKTPVERVQEYFQQYSGAGLFTANGGKYQVFYRPHHLPGLETGVSVVHAALNDEATGTTRSQNTDVVGVTKQALDPGTELDGGGGYTVYGRLEKVDTASEKGHVPFELLEGATVVTELEKDQVVTYDDVELDEDTLLYTLRQLQEETM